MKTTATKSTAEILNKIETIEKEVRILKLSVLKKLTPSGKRVVKLKGILKGVDITDEDIAAARKAPFPKIAIS